MYLFVTAPVLEPEEIKEEIPYPEIEEKEYDLNKFAECYENFRMEDWYSLLMCAPVACEMQGYEIDEFPTGLDMKIECIKEETGETIYIEIPEVEECRHHLEAKEMIVNCIEEEQV